MRLRLHSWGFEIIHNGADHSSERVISSSAHRRNLYLTTPSTHNRQIFMPSTGLEPTTSSGERPQTHVLDRAATGRTYVCVCVYTHNLYVQLIYIYIYIYIYTYINVTSLLNNFWKSLCTFVHFVLPAWLCNEVRQQTWQSVVTPQCWQTACRCVLCVWCY